MNNFYKFAEDNPWLTFFLLALVCECIARSIEVLKK